MIFNIDVFYTSMMFEIFDECYKILIINKQLDWNFNEIRM